MNTKLKNFFMGIKDTSPLMIPVVPFGIIFGVLAIDLGLTPLTAISMSIIIFGGASQIIFLQLFSAGASSLIILSSVGAVNSRHLLYGTVLSEHLSDLSLTWKIIVSYFLVDQAFAVSNDYFKKNKKDRYKHFHLIGGGLNCWIIWQITTIIGIYLGSIIPEKLGLTFAIPLTFLALLVNDFRKLINLIVIITSGSIATLGYQIVPFKAYIIVAAAAGLLVAIILTSFIKKKL
jgi:4-azaleucine resistance transporter AzlC